MKKYLISSMVAVSIFTATSLSAKVYATVDGKDVTDQDIAGILSVVPGADFKTLPEAQKKQIVNQAVDKYLLAKKALKSGVDKDPKYKETLEKVKGELALELWMKKEFDSVKVSEKDMKAFYDKNDKMFNQPEMAKAKHILVKDEKEAKAIIGELKKAKNLKETFVKLAAEKSTGPSGKNGGELGWFDRKRMVPEFSDATFKLKKGDFTKTPVKTQFGYHIILLEDKKPAQKVAFEKAKARIEQSLKVEKFQEKMKKTSKDLRSKADISIKSF